MANFKFNAQNIWASVRKFFSTAWTWTKNGFEGIIFFVIVLVRVICVYNPVLFPIWVLLGYRKSPAKVMFGEKKSFWDELWDAAPQAFCRWQLYCFPWFIKRDFVKLYPTSFAWEDQVKLALELPVDEKHLFVDRMEEEAVALLWQRDDYACNMAIIKKRKEKMSKEILSFLLEKGELDVIICFLSDAPSTECVEEMVDAATYEHKHKVAIDSLRYTALKHGLSAQLIEKVYSKMREDDIALIEEALVQRSQYQMIDRLKDCKTENKLMWAQFCSKNKKVWDNAQKLMRYWMLETFYATGHHLSDSAMMYFFASSDNNKKDIVKIICENEQQLDGKVMSMIRSMPDVYAIYTQTRKD